MRVAPTLGPECDSQMGFPALLSSFFSSSSSSSSLTHDEDEVEDGDAPPFPPEQLEQRFESGRREDLVERRNQRVRGWKAEGLELEETEDLCHDLT